MRSIGKSGIKIFVWQSLFWILLSAVVFAYFYVSYTKKYAFDFLSAYIIEKMLSLDNLFVFLMIFKKFEIKKKLQKKALLFGLIGAICMRIIVIYIGITTVRSFDLILYILGLFLIYTSVKFFKEEKTQSGIKLSFLKSWVKFKDKSDHFFIRIKGKIFITKFFFVIILIELTDLFFAIDSLAAVFSITTDTTIVILSNVLAICGLRALFFVIDYYVGKLKHINHALSFILGFSGIKLLVKDILHIPSSVTLAYIVIVFAVFFFLSKSTVLKK